MRFQDERTALQSIMPRAEADRLSAGVSRLMAGMAGVTQVSEAEEDGERNDDGVVDGVDGPSHDDDAHMDEVIESAAKLYSKLRSLAVKAAFLIERADVEVCENLAYHASELADANEEIDAMIYGMLKAMGYSA